MQRIKSEADLIRDNRRTTFETWALAMVHLHRTGSVSALTFFESVLPMVTEANLNRFRDRGTQMEVEEGMTLLCGHVEDIWVEDYRPYAGCLAPNLENRTLEQRRDSRSPAPAGGTMRIGPPRRFAERRRSAERARIEREEDIQSKRRARGELLRGLAKRATIASNDEEDEVAISRGRRAISFTKSGSGQSSRPGVRVARSHEPTASTSHQPRPDPMEGSSSRAGPSDPMRLGRFSRDALHKQLEKQESKIFQLELTRMDLDTKEHATRESISNIRSYLQLSDEEHEVKLEEETEWDSE
ncbi:hypothetical protein QCA50_018706 [Cerrena zonata]|uniref:Uncharacterized protein n=1 Tax=Cerrena zonata TaxID=2478898 RepID=A0AAW0FAS3_9APHY